MVTQMPARPAARPEELWLPIQYRCYDVRVERAEKPLLGTPILQLSLLFDSREKIVSGFGRVYNPTTHPLVDLVYAVRGEYSETFLGGLFIHIVRLIGFDMPLVIPPHPPFEALMALSEDWKTGTAEYKYSTWHTVIDAEAHQIPCPVPEESR